MISSWLFWIPAAAIAMQPPGANTPAAAHFQQGVAHERAGRLAEARAEYESALGLDAGRADARANLGAVLLRMGMAAPAVDQFEKVLALRPDLLPVRFFLGLAYFQSDRFAPARAELQRVLAAQPGDARALHLDALCLLKLDRLEEGARALERVVQTAPGNTAAVLTLATTWVSLGETDKAQAMIEGPLAGHPPEHASLVRGMLFNVRGKYREAESALRQAAAANPKLPTLHNQLGYTLMLLGDYAAAVREFETELSLSPRDFNASANLGWIHAQEREFEDAAPFLAEALAQKPDNAGILYLMGQAWLAKGEPAKAAAALEKSVTHQPGFRAAHVLLARAYARLGRGGDAAREQGVITRLNAEEQARNLQSAASYGEAAAPAPEFSGSGRKK